MPTSWALLFPRPNGWLRLDCEGFGADVDDAIGKAMDPNKERIPSLIALKPSDPGRHVFAKISATEWRVGRDHL